MRRSLVILLNRNFADGFYRYGRVVSFFIIGGIMLNSIGIIILLGMFFGFVFKRINLPSLLGMLLLGILIGPYGLNLLDQTILDISKDLRQIALVIILTRAGLSLDLEDLKKVGRPAFFLSFLPALMEILGSFILAPIIFGVSKLDALLIGSVIAAVSPAVVVPRMIMVMENGYGTEKGIPQMILAGASIDDVFVIVIFTSLLGVYDGGGVSLMSFFQIPISIISGLALGYIVSIVLLKIFKSFFDDSYKMLLVLLSTSFLILSVETILKPYLPVSGLLAIMGMGLSIKFKNPDLAENLSYKYNNMWKGAEVFLFVLVGAEVNINYALLQGYLPIILVLGALLFRLVGVIVSLIGTNLNNKEKIFTLISYSPKATVQAAIGSIPLSLGIGAGDLVLTIAVMSILITAPLGAIGIDYTYRRFLKKAS